MRHNVGLPAVAGGAFGLSVGFTASY